MTGVLVNVLWHKTGENNSGLRNMYDWEGNLQSAPPWRTEETSSWEDYSTRIHDASGSSWSGLGRWPAPLPDREWERERRTDDYKSSIMNGVEGVHADSHFGEGSPEGTP